MTDYHKRIDYLKEKEVLKFKEIAEILEIDDNRSTNHFYGSIVQFSSLLPIDNDEIVNEIEVPNTRATWQDIAKSLMCEISLNDSVAKKPKG